jgi:hypothetical protein
MRHCEEFPLLAWAALPNLPSGTQLRNLLNTFFARIWPLFPVVDRKTLEQSIDHLLNLQEAHPDGLTHALGSVNVSELATAYAVLCLSLDENNRCVTDTSTKFISGAYNLYAHLIAMPYLPSVQALFLLAVCLRGQARDGQGWHVIGHAVRIAQSLGLHKDTSIPSSFDEYAPEQPQTLAKIPLPRRVWWSCFALEKLLQLESGRPSMTDDNDYNSMPSPPHHDSTSPQARRSCAFEAWVSLARIMGQISDRIYAPKFNSSFEMFQETGRIDQALVVWEQSMPELLGFSPEAPVQSLIEDALGNEDEQFATSFIAMQFYHVSSPPCPVALPMCFVVFYLLRRDFLLNYCTKLTSSYQAQIALLRVSIVFRPSAYTAEVRSHGKTLPSYPRLVRGATICTSAARNIVMQMLSLADQPIKSNILGINQVLLAAVVLSLSIIRQPGLHLARSDIELFNMATEHAEDFYTRWGHNPDFSNVCAVLRDGTNQIFKLASRSPGNAQGHDPIRYRGFGAEVSNGTPLTDRLSTSNLGPDTVPELNAFTYEDSGFPGMELEELFNFFNSEVMLGDAIDLTRPY